MIGLDFSQFVFVYLFAFLGLVLSVWFRHNLIVLRRRRASFRHRVICRLCSFEFREESGEELPRCPKCGSPTERDAPPPV